VADVDPLQHEGLLHVLGEAQRIGALGTQPVRDIIDHATAFVAALPASTQSCVDLGSGAGVPGLVIAIARPHLHMTLVDRRSKRTDSLERAVRILGIQDRVTVVCADVEDFSRRPGITGSFDAACARGFGPPEYTIRWSAELVRSGGVVVVSEPPAESPDRWEHRELETLGITGYERKGRVAVFHVEHS
jgi:16S rRNA (guanine527-N7)-methyltransferase